MNEKEIECLRQLNLALSKEPQTKDDENMGLVIYRTRGFNLTPNEKKKVLGICTQLAYYMRLSQLLPYLASKELLKVKETSQKEYDKLMDFCCSLMMRNGRLEDNDQSTPE